MKNLAIRAATGTVYVALILGAAWAGRNTTFLLFLPFCLLAAFELHRLVRPDGGSLAWSVILAGIAYAALAAIALYGYWRPTHAFMVIAILCVAALAASLRGEVQQVARSMGITLMLLVFIALPFASLTHLASFGHWPLIGFMLVLWANDTGAYLSGKALGRRKLASHISPGKTLEGVIGGALAALTVAWTVGRLDAEYGLRTWLLAGAAIIITATLGDLMESALKRAAGVKDSGRLLPGHGGMLDRTDGLLLAAPVHWAIMVLSGAPS